MSRDHLRDHALHLAWVNQLDETRRATQWPRIGDAAAWNSAIAAHMRHDAAGLHDPGTESLIDQTFVPTVPAELNDTPRTLDADRPGDDSLFWLVVLVLIVIGVVGVVSLATHSVA